MKIKIKSDIVRRIDPETKKPYWSRETIEVHKPEEQDRIEAPDFVNAYPKTPQ